MHSANIVSSVIDALVRKVAAQAADCPDPQCAARLVWTNDTKVQCYLCGQTFDVASLSNVETAKMTPLEVISNSHVDIPVECIEISGYSNFDCRLIAPLLTTYGIDKDGRPRLISELNAAKKRNQPSEPRNEHSRVVSNVDSAMSDDIFDVSVLSDRAFLIEPDRLEQAGYGIDRHAATYLADTIELVERANTPFQQECAGADSFDYPCLVPLVTSGDGRCLAHAISRALVGRELFTHALLTGLHSYIAANWQRLRQACDGFLTESDAEAVLNECNPSGVQVGSSAEESADAGLRPVHIFAFANLLRRPIVVLDSLAGVCSNAEYACVYLPSLCDPAACGNVKDGRFVPNSPLFIGWANAARNHFVPLVGLRGRPAVRFPSVLLAKTFSTPASAVARYVQLTQSSNTCVQAAGRMLASAYLFKLVCAMREQFRALHGFSTAFVSTVYRVCFFQHGEELGSLVRSLLRDRFSRERIALQRARQLQAAMCSEQHAPETRALFSKVIKEMQRVEESRKDALAQREERRKVQALRSALLRRLQPLLAQDGLLSDSPFVPDNFSRTLLALERDLESNTDQYKSNQFDPQSALKSCATGWSSQTFHKEELNEANPAERELLRRVRENAVDRQQKASASAACSATNSANAKRKSEADRTSSKQTRLEPLVKESETPKHASATAATNSSSVLRLRVADAANHSDSHIMCVTPMTTYAEFISLVEKSFSRRLSKLWYAVGLHSQPRLVDVLRCEACGMSIDFEMTRVAFVNGERINAEFVDSNHFKTTPHKLADQRRTIQQIGNKSESESAAQQHAEQVKVETRLQEVETAMKLWCKLLGTQEMDAEAAAAVLSRPLRDVVLGWLNICAEHDSQSLKSGGCVYEAVRHANDLENPPRSGTDYHCDVLFPDVTFRYVDSLSAFRVFRVDADADADSPDPKAAIDSPCAADATETTPIEASELQDVETVQRTVINDFYLDDDDDTELERLAEANGNA